MLGSKRKRKMRMAKKENTYPVVDLFAGPGGLGEGLAALRTRQGNSAFHSIVSIERDDHAHDTLTLRHFFRLFHPSVLPDAYYEYIAGQISKNDLINQFPVQWKEAQSSSLKISLGSENHSHVKSVIGRRLKNQKRWALVGGPPCQAYSLVGRSRMMNSPEFERDERHFLYREYLKIIIDHKPPVFVMENVKGLLSSKVNDELVIKKIVDDLSSPIKAIRRTENGLRYKLFSLTGTSLFQDEVDPREFIVKAENHGVPQARHRMFILGIRDDLNVVPIKLSFCAPPTVRNVIGNMHHLRSGVSKAENSVDGWRRIMSETLHTEWYAQLATMNDDKLAKNIQGIVSAISRSPKNTESLLYKEPSCMSDWYYDGRLKALTGHESRAHMPSDLHRYLFASVFARTHKTSPKLKDFPPALLPKHESARRKNGLWVFEDRFRVQLPSTVSTTITSHISKDGHYFIHYDPRQCRSLTIREAARLQTFPDSYHFEGPRTAQYHQIGNAVPPFLAKQIAQVVKEILDAIPGR